MFSLTKKQAAVKQFLVAFTAEHGFAPSYQEIADALGIKSKSGAFNLMAALEQRGHIDRIPGLARAVRINGQGDTK